MLRKIISNFTGILLCILFTSFIGYLFVIAEIWKPAWMKKNKHTILHKHKGYQVKQVIYHWTPIIGDSYLFGYGLNTDEVKEYSE